ncbi:MAG: HAD hydrolase-like protein [Anaerolineales bacterium]|nr:HAD hydrolase-like protein [Anaerolineales bacterium]
MPDYPAAAQPLVDLVPGHEYFVGIDSDGCAFDTMEIKQKECFIPNTVKHWGMQPVSKYTREVEEWVNLYSKWRGINRWPALVMVFDLLRDRPEVKARNFDPPQVSDLRAFIDDDNYPKSDDGLRSYKEKNPSIDLDTALAWTVGVNETIREIVRDVPPFPFLRDSLEFLSDKADMIVVSATPVEALTREWKEHRIAQYVKVIAGQELGKKALHLELATKGKYKEDHVLMIGDAPGDMKAARANNALFYPIYPGREEESWQRFYEEGLHRFLAGEYADQYEAALITEFETLLPEVPPWL